MGASTELISGNSRLNQTQPRIQSQNQQFNMCCNARGDSNEKSLSAGLISRCSIGTAVSQVLGRCHLNIQSPRLGPKFKQSESLQSDASIKFDLKTGSRPEGHSNSPFSLTTYELRFYVHSLASKSMLKAVNLILIIHKCILLLLP